MKRVLCAGAVLLGLVGGTARADERHFTYSYEANTLPEGQWELEQWVTNENGHEDGDYSAWELRTEIEYGVTSNYMTAFYLNWESVRESIDKEESTDTEFKGVSWENIYQLTNPNLDPVGTALYLEGTTDGLDSELEGKLLVSKPLGNFELVGNAVYAMEWEREDQQTEREAELEFTMGASYHLTPAWAIGVEARNLSKYPGGFNLSGQEFQTWSVGPNIHYGSPRWWATLTALPQVWGNGDGSEGGRNLVHEEALEVRLIVGVLF